MVDEELERMARAETIRLILAMHDALFPDLSIAEAKHWAGILERMGPAVREPGALARSLAAVRAHRSR